MARTPEAYVSEALGTLTLTNLMLRQQLDSLLEEQQKMVQGKRKKKSEESPA